jgi:hypothetical protein
MGTVVDRAALGHVLSEYFGFPCQLFIPLIASQPSRAGAIGQLLELTKDDIFSGLTLFVATDYAVCFVQNKGKVLHELRLISTTP